MSSENEKKITLVSSDSKTFEVDMAVAELCQTIKNMIEDGYSGSSIPLPNVTSGALAKVIDYSKKHLSGEEEKEPRAWEAKFAENLDIAAVFEFMLAANYLNHKSLLDFGAQCAADLIKDKSAEEVRNIFNITNDFTPEEEEEVRKENPWIHDP